MQAVNADSSRTSIPASNRLEAQRFMREQGTQIRVEKHPQQYGQTTVRLGRRSSMTASTKLNTE